MMFVTGFGAFGDVTENPSGWLAKHCGLPFQVLDVTYAAADGFIEEVRNEADKYSGLLHLGVAAKSEKLRLELTAMNLTGMASDNEGRGGFGPINLASGNLMSTLWTPELLANPPENTEVSVNAGDYLCNYLLYRSLSAFPMHRIGFLHVPLASAIPLETQLEIVKSLIARLQA